jgi:hypothetical protein
VVRWIRNREFAILVVWTLATNIAMLD